MPDLNTPRRWLVLPLLGCLLASVTADLDQDPAPDTAPFPRTGQYCGPDRCIECHDIEADAIADNPHRAIVRDPSVTGCETCHGPGHAHAADADNATGLVTYPPGLSAAHQARLCGRCHRPEADGHGGDAAGFLAAGLGCTDCHGVHSEATAGGAPTVLAHSKAGLDAIAEPVGSAKCKECHPVRDQLLAASAHHSLATPSSDTGCESCHGQGDLHSEHLAARLITRPDRARDGIATCRSCHEQVDPVWFHWPGKHRPLLSEGMSCTTCHVVHQPASGLDPSTGEPAATNRLCSTCHAPAFDLLKGTIHTDLAGLDTPLALGCGACHDGAENHARTAGERDLVVSLRGTDANTQRRVCGACHEREPALRHVGVGAHLRRDVGCLSCHSPAAKLGQARADAERRCNQCHASVAAQFKQVNRHPVGTGHMYCSDCHEPHGARPRLRDLELKERVCLDCHKQYRGPYVFAHQASRLDGCVICHAPHGSSNRRMLKQVNTQQNCLQCHGDWPAFHDQTAGSIYTNCLNCHTEVHGSNHSRFFFR